jgi:hypothetical protein
MLKPLQLLGLVLILDILLLSSSIPTKAQAPAAPVAVEDRYTADEDHHLIVPAPGVLANDTQVDDKPLTAILVDDVRSGSLSFNQDGSFRYTPKNNFNGVASFTYRVNDGGLEAELLATPGPGDDVTTVTLIINPINDSPEITGLPHSLTVDEGSSIRFNLSEKVIDVETAPADMHWTSRPSDKTVVSAMVDSAQAAVITAIEGEGRANIQFNVVDRGDPDGCEVSASSRARGEALSASCSEPASANHTIAVTVENVSPSVDAGRDAAVEVGEQFQIQATFTDPGVQDTHEATIDFGDGAGPQPATMSQEAGSGTVTGTKVYLGLPRIYTLEVCVTDDDGGTGCDTLSLTVMEGPPALPGPFPDKPDLPETPTTPPEQPTPPEEPGLPDRETIWRK